MAAIQRTTGKNDHHHASNDANHGAFTHHDIDPTTTFQGQGIESQPGPEGNNENDDTDSESDEEPAPWDILDEEANLIAAIRGEDWYDTLNPTDTEDDVSSITGQEAPCDRHRSVDSTHTHHSHEVNHSGPLPTTAAQAEHFGHPLGTTTIDRNSFPGQIVLEGRNCTSFCKHFDTLANSTAHILACQEVGLDIANIPKMKNQ